MFFYSLSLLLKVALGFVFVEGDVQWNERNAIICPLLCVLAGFFAGMFGVGGGIIKVGHVLNRDRKR